jgi:hypothetical protein
LEKTVPGEIAGQMSATFSYYTCADCGTRWCRQMDPNDPVVGWIPLG